MTMKICVMGLGYVGTVVAGCLARDGHDVIGVDVDRDKIDQINAGRAPIVEPQIDAIVEAAVAARRLTATTDTPPAVRASELVLVCVGTPSRANGSIDLQHLQRVCEQIGAALRHHPGAPVIAIRSTVLPGTTRGVVIPLLESASGKRAGVEFGICVNPEFLREASADRKSVV